MVGVCKNVSLCTGAAIAGNCSLSSHICCVPEPAMSLSSEFISVDTFLNVTGDTVRNRAIYPYFIDSLIAANITSLYQIAAYLSQVIDETDYFIKIDSLIIEKDVNQVIGINQLPDDIIFRGRGGILLKGRNTYNLAQNGSNFTFNIYTEPERVSFPSVALKTAAWYWTKNAYAVTNKTSPVQTNLNSLADGTFLGFTQLTHSLTSNIRSFKKRAILNEKILYKFDAAPMKRGEGVNCTLSDGTPGYAVPICLADLKRSYCGCEGRYEVQTCPYDRNSGK